MSDGWPFSPDDWARVQDAARDVVNASLIADEVLRASRFEELREVLGDLRSRYGPHPVLWETEADFTDHPAERLELYRMAVELAERDGYVTFTIRISLAKLLLDEFGRRDEARRELAACEAELATHADESDRRTWSNLMARCTGVPS